nr:RNA polymerase sigma-70 factor [uncultured Proteiniphilum sp.]
MITWETLYTEHFRKSFLFVKSYVFDDMAAEDIVSECILQTWQESRVTPIASIKAYLFTLLKNRSLDYLKHERIKYKSFDAISNNHFNELTLRINTLEACLPQYVLTDEIMDIINETLTHVLPLSKEIFIQSRFSGHSNKKIAENMNITVKNVEYHITKVLRLLRESLRDYLIYTVFILSTFLH